MNCTVSAKRLVPGIIAIGIACTFVLLSFSISAVPSHSNLTLVKQSSTDKSVANSNSSMLENSNSTGIGYVKYTLILNNNSLVYGNVQNEENGINPIGVVFDPLNGYIYFVGGSSNSVIVVNGSTNSIVDTIPVGREPQDAAFSPINGFVYVTNQLHNSVTVINGTTDRIVANLSVGDGPIGLAVDSANGLVYVANFASNNVSVINATTDRTVANLIVGSDPIGVAFDPASGTMYVMNSLSNNITVINGTSNEVIKSIPVGQSPDWATFDPGNGYIYVANTISGNISVINGTSNSVINTFNVQVGGPNGMALCPSNGYLYVASGSNWVNVFNLTADKSPTGITVGSDPQEVVFDSSNGYLYVSNYNSGTASIISTAAQTFKPYSVTFTETGLEAGSIWYVNFNGMNKSSTASTITYSAINGTYPFTAGSVNGYGSSPASGKITVKGGDVSQVISFPPSGGSQPFGLSGTEIYIVGTVVAVAIIGVSAFLLTRKRKQI